MLGIVGGSGLYEIPELTSKKWKRVNSEFGKPSDHLLFGRIIDQDVVFLPRHGRGHRLNPSEINYRANIDALKQVGVSEIISISAVGSLTEKFPPGTFVLVNQFIDRTFLRRKTFYENGFVVHVSMAKPVCERLNRIIKDIAEENSITLKTGGNYLVMEGPQFSTYAESELYRKWGCSLIGMTNMPEAKLAREAEICYSTIAMVTDFDCWHSEHDEVTVEKVLVQMQKNIINVRKLISLVIKGQINLKSSSCKCHEALDGAVLTDPKYWEAETLKAYNNVAGRILSKFFDSEG